MKYTTKELVESEARRVTALTDTLGLDGAMSVVIRNYNIYLRFLRSAPAGVVTRKPILTSIMYYRRLLREHDLPFAACYISGVSL